MDAPQIIATIIGIIVYLYFNNKNKPTKRKGSSFNPTPPPIQKRQQISMPEPESEPYIPSPMPEPAFNEYEEEEEPQYEEETLTDNTSFEELLQQFTSPTEKPAPRVIDEPFERVEYQTVKKAQREEDVNHKHSLLSKEDREKRYDAFKIKKHKKNKFAAILQNPESARDAFILKEIFDRKYF